jgi:NDP-sugar pyrophosphorylase family protein
LKALILAAGFGTRLGALTETIPKPMLPIYGQPMLSYTVRYLAGFGFDQIALNLHFQPDIIQSYLGDGSQYGVQITYSLEQELLGTAGALVPLKRFFENEPHFLVIYGDIITNQNLANLVNFHHRSKAMATLLVHKRKHSNSIIELDQAGRIHTFLERPEQPIQNAHSDHWVNSGVQILSPRIFDYLPSKLPADLPRDVYAPFINQLAIYGFPLDGYRCAVDSQERYNQVCRDVENGQLVFQWSKQHTKP